MVLIGKIPFDSVIRFSNNAIRMTACLLPTNDVDERQKLRFELYRAFCAIFTLSWTIHLFCGVYVYGHDLESVLVCICDLTPQFAGTVTLFLCTYNQQKFQYCVADLENFLKKAKPRELEFLQEWTDNHIGPYILLLVVSVTCGIGYCFSPLYFDQPLPGRTPYPFEVTGIRRCILWSLQILAVTQSTLLVQVDYEFAIFLWVTTVRFLLLSKELESIDDLQQLQIWLRKHQKLLEVADEVVSITRLICVACVLNYTAGLVCAALQILRKSNILSAMRYVVYAMVVLLQLFLFSWPAESLMHASEVIGYAAYNSNWIGKSREITTLLLIVMQRATKPVLVSVGIFIPALSLAYYASFLSMSFSLFTTLRATTDISN